MTDLVKIWTDGSTYPNNPGQGGWAAVMVYGERARLLAGRIDEATINVAEAHAVLVALTKLTRPCMVRIYTDSQYVENGFRALAHGRILSSNQKLWESIRGLYEYHLAVRVELIRAHKATTHVHNQVCDRFAYMAAAGIIEKEDRYVTVSEIAKERKARPKKRKKPSVKSV